MWSRSTRGFPGVLPGISVQQSPQQGPSMRCLMPAWGAKLCVGVSGNPWPSLPGVQVLKPPAAPRSCPTCPDPVCGSQVGLLGDKEHQRTQQTGACQNTALPAPSQGGNTHPWRAGGQAGRRASWQLRVCRGWGGGRVGPSQAGRPTGPLTDSGIQAERGCAGTERSWLPARMENGAPFAGLRPATADS